MSASDGEYKLFRHVGQDRLLYEMLKASASSRGSWKVFIMDKVTVKVMSASCKMSDITDQGVSLVEQLFKRREPMPGMDVVYFVQPIYENLVMFMSDMSGKQPLYKKAFVFFSSSIPKDFVGRIKSDSTVVPRIGALREMNLEYFPIDNQYAELSFTCEGISPSWPKVAFLTDHGGALEDLYSEDAENTHDFNICLKSMATRLATVFASLKELPVVRYRVKEADESTQSTFRDSIPKKLALEVWEYISSYKTTIPNYPQVETCELLIVDRSVDLVAPIIHEWTYDAMCHDLVDLNGNKYVMQVPSKSGGPPERKEFVLEDHDPVWVEMRYLHIADASERLSDKMDNLMSKNKAAQLQQKDTSELSTRDIQKMVQDLPAYNEMMEKLSLHVEIAGKINQVISEDGLRDLGQIEQDLVFGDAGHKELLEYLSENEDGNYENMLRLMMIYALADPEKFEGDNGPKLLEVGPFRLLVFSKFSEPLMSYRSLIWEELASLSQNEMRMIENMRLLEGPVKKKKQETKGGFLNIGNKKANNALRKDKQGEEETWALFRFFPVIEELIEKIDKQDLPKDEYKCINDPSTQGVSGHVAGRAAAQQSRRSRRTPGAGKASDDGHSSDSALKNAANDLKHMGQRIFIFIIGGATRSELRICHKLTSKLRREVVLGSTSIDDPPMYLTKLKMLSMRGHDMLFTMNDDM